MNGLWRLKPKPIREFPIGCYTAGFGLIRQCFAKKITQLRQIP